MTDTYEICPHCEEEVLLKDAKLKTKQKCPCCGRMILPCSLCEDFSRCCECEDKIQWNHYLKYLLQWANDHSDMKYKGMSPACFDEFCDNDDDDYYDEKSFAEIIYELKFNEKEK